MIQTYIPKENQELPDTYTVTIYYVNGKKETLELASHTIRDKIVIPVDENINRYEASPCPFLEYSTKDDLWGWIPVSSIQRLEFDKNFSKIMEIKAKEEENKRK